jgi:membrane-bound lytic murein transglycosylase
MTREDIKKLFPDATDEQINNLLNQHNGEIQGERSKSDKDKAELTRLKAVEKEFGEFKNKNLTEAEKLEQEKKALAEEKSKYVKAMNRVEVEKVLVQGGIKEEDYKDAIESMVTEDKDASVKLATWFTKIVSAKAEAAAKEKEKSLMDNLGERAGTPGGNPPKKTKAEQFAETAAKSLGGTKTTEILNNYIGGKE